MKRTKLRKKAKKCDVCNKEMQEETNIWICINDKCPALREYEGGYKGCNWLKK